MPTTTSFFVTPSATNPKVTDRKLWDAFRTCGRDDQQGKLWADLALGDLKDKRSPSSTTRPPTARVSPTPRAAS